MMPSARGIDGRIAAQLTFPLWQHVKSNKRGEVYAAETRFLLSQDTESVRAPAVAFMHTNRLVDVGDVEGYHPLSPNLVAEIISPDATVTQAEEKALA